MKITERIQSRKDVKAISVRLLGDYKGSPAKFRVEFDINILQKG